MIRRGFTLIETLIALGLITLLAGLMLDFGLNLAASRDSLTQRGTRQHAITAVFHKIDRALTAADANGTGVKINATELVITSRTVLADPSVEEFDTLTIRFSQGAASLISSSSTRGGEANVEQIVHAEFKAFDGTEWGAFEGPTLPQAVAVSVWYEPRTPPTPEEELEIELPIEQTRAPDRWRVFGLVDTLPEIGS